MKCVQRFFITLSFIVLSVFKSQAVEALKIGDYINLYSRKPLIILGHTKIIALTDKTITVKSKKDLLADTYTFELKNVQVILTSTGIPKADSSQFFTRPVIPDQLPTTQNQNNIIVLL